MKASELIGKNAIRTEPIEEIVENYGSFFSPVTKRPNYAFTTKPIKILKATDSHIVYEQEGFSNTTYKNVLDKRYCDDNWIDYDKLIATESEEAKQDEISIDNTLPDEITTDISQESKEEMI